MEFDVDDVACGRPAAKRERAAAAATVVPAWRVRRARARADLRRALLDWMPGVSARAAVAHRDDLFAREHLFHTDVVVCSTPRATMRRALLLRAMTI